MKLITTSLFALLRKLLVRKRATARSLGTALIATALLCACHPEPTTNSARNVGPPPKIKNTPVAKIEYEAPKGPLRWEKSAELPAKHHQACDLESVNGDLYIAASTNALTENGAGLYRLTQDKTLEKIFDWTGQGFLRVHQAGDKILVPDADAPFGVGFFFRLDVDGFVFAFDANDPKKYTKEVIPSVYHVLDTAVLDGRLYASSGAYAEGEIPYRNERNPAALFVQDSSGKPWRRVVEFPQVPKGQNTGVVRFTFLLPLENGTLLAGFTDWSNVSGGDGAVFIEGLPDAPKVTRVQGLNASPLRWGKFGDKLYEISDDGGSTRLHISRDGGHTFSLVSNAPVYPQSMVAAKDALFLLADGTLYRSEDGENFKAITEQNAELRYQWTPLVTAPLALHQGQLWAANPLTGKIFRTTAQ
jgi:hypothetical protein